MDINILISMFFVVILVMMIALIKYVWLHSQAQERYLTAEYDLEELEDELGAKECQLLSSEVQILELRTTIQDQERILERMGGFEELRTERHKLGWNGYE